MGYSDLDPAVHERRPWNAGQNVGPKRPLKPRDIWAIRFYLDEHTASAITPPLLYTVPSRNVGDGKAENAALGILDRHNDRLAVSVGPFLHEYLLVWVLRPRLRASLVPFL